MATRPGEILLFASPGLLAQENLDLLMAITFQRHEEAAHNSSKKIPKLELEQKRRMISEVLLSATIFIAFWTNFEARGRRNVDKIIRKTTQFWRVGRTGKTAFRLRRPERIEGRTLQEATENAKETRIANITLRMSLFD